MLQMGCLMKAKNNGSFGKLRDYEERKYDVDWVEGKNIRDTPFSYSNFCTFWSAHYPKLKIMISLISSLVNIFPLCPPLIVVIM